jgi:hypothetical protein
MTENQKAGNGWASAMRWGARILGLIALGLFVVFLATSGARVLSALSWTSPQGIPLLLALLATIGGVILAWRWELVGGAIAVVGAFVIMALVCAGSGTDMLPCAVMFTMPLLLAGALFLGCCARARVSSHA